MLISMPTDTSTIFGAFQAILNLHFESGQTRSQFQNGQKSELLFVALSKTDEHRLRK
jgi:hypothetical protein